MREPLSHDVTDLTNRRSSAQSSSPPTFAASGLISAMRVPLAPALVSRCLHGSQLVRDVGAHLLNGTVGHRAANYGNRPECVECNVMWNDQRKAVMELPEASYWFSSPLGLGLPRRTNEFHPARIIMLV
jgi:hypothetical protein